MNDAPQATVAATASYTENAAPVVLSPASTVTDVDNITLVSGEVRIVSAAVDGDLLTVNGLQSGTFAGIDFSYDAVLHDLTFTGPTTVADYQAFLQAVAFSSTSDNPTNSGLNPTRTLSWFVSDGDAFSAVQTTVVSITAVADPPVNTVPGAQSVNEDTTLPIAGVSVADPDSSTLTTTLTVLNGTLHVTAGTGVSNNDTGSVTIAGTLARDQRGARRPLLHRQSQLQRLRHAHGHHRRRHRAGHRHGRHHRQPGERRAGQHGAGRAERQRGHDAADRRRVGRGRGQHRAHDHADGDERHAQRDAGRRRDHRRQRHRHGDASRARAAQINAALAGLTYTGNLNFNGSDTLTVTTGDGTAQDIDTVAITVNPVNDAPVNTVPGAQSVNEDTTLPIAGVSVADVDSTALTDHADGDATARST